MLDFATFHLSKCNTACKKTFLNLWPNLSYLGIFGLELEKTSLLLYFTSAPPNFPKHKISSKIKILKFGTKISLIMYFGLEFLKTNVVFEISISNLLTWNISSKNKKTLNLGAKIPSLRVFGLKFGNTIVIIEINTLEIVLRQSLV